MAFGWLGLRGNADAQDAMVATCAGVDVLAMIGVVVVICRDLLSGRAVPGLRGFAEFGFDAVEVDVGIACDLRTGVGGCGAALDGDHGGGEERDQQQLNCEQPERASRSEEPASLSVIHRRCFHLHLPPLDWYDCVWL